ncbi:MAG: TetR family transcriptional regulator [Pseudooceanicola sp.]
MKTKSTDPTDSSASARILSAAEMLFSRHGVDTTSVRQITGEAGVNVASVNYYFGSKDDLAEAVFERVIARVSRDRLRALDRILTRAEAAGRSPDLAAIVSSFVEPYLGDGNEEQGVLLARFILSHRLSPDDATRRIVGKYLNPLAQSYVAAFAKACPGVDEKDLFWRYLLMVSVTVLTSAEDRKADRLSTLSGGRARIVDRAAVRDALVGFAVAGISSKGEAGYVPDTLRFDDAPED